MKTWTRYPFVRLVIPLMTGILLQKYCSSWLILPLWFVIIPLLVLPGLKYLPLKSSYSGRWIYGLFINLFLILLGFQLSVLHQNGKHRSHFSNLSLKNNEVYSGIVDNEPAERANSYRFTLKTDVIKTGDVLRSVSGKVMVYVSKDSLAKSIQFGDRLIFASIPEVVPGPKNPEEFDYAAYLENKGIYHQVFLRTGSYEIKYDAGGNIFQAFAYKVRKELLRLFKDAGMDGREYAVAAALMIGYGDLLDADQREEFAGAGAMHILCVSGLHVGIIFVLADKLFFFLRKRKRGIWLRPLLILLVIWFYALITGLAPSVMRASLMFSLVTIGGALNRKSHIVNSIAASAFILMLNNPAIIFELGFQLSYAAVLGIVLLQPHFQKLFIPRNKFEKYLWSIVTVSLAAQIATGPISLMYFHQFPNYFLLTNIIVIPLAGVLIYSGLAFVLLSQIPVLSTIASTVLILELKFMNSAVGLIEGLPGAVSRNIYLSGLSTFLLYMVVLCLFVSFLYKNRYWFRLGIASLAVFLGIMAFTDIQRANRHELIIHNLRSHTAIGLHKNREYVLFTDSALIANSEKLSYPLDGYMIKHGLRKVELVNVFDGNAQRETPMVYRGFIVAGGKKIAVVSDKSSLPEAGKQIKVDYVVLTGNPWVKANEMSAAFPGATFVIDASNWARKTEEWVEDFNKLNANTYSIAQNGALVVKL